MIPIIIYAIAKNEEKFVDRFMQSAGKADGVFVLDTGSTDGTVEQLEKHGAVVAVREIRPWRFDTARNAAMEMCPQDSIFFSLDLDEIIAEPDWMDRIRKVWGPQCNRGRYRYVWSTREDGSEGHVFNYEKIHTSDYHWCLPCHELLCPKSGVVDCWADIPITVKHYPDASRPRSDYLPLLKMGAKELPCNDRMAYYLGRELFFHFQRQEAIAELKRFLALPTALWPDERCSAMTMIAKCFEGLHSDREAEQWHLRACGEAPHLREPFVEAAMFYNSRNHFPMGWALAKRALQIESRTASYITTPYAWNEGPWDLASIAAYYVGMKPESLAYARKAFEYAPWDARLKSNLEIVERMCPDLVEPSVKATASLPSTNGTRFGLLISTYGSVPYIHASLEVHRQLCPGLPILVVDDGSPESEALDKLCSSYLVAFRSNVERMNHTRGDMLAYATGLKWAAGNGVDVLVKMSRRFIPKTDWRPSLHDAIERKIHATYSGVMDGTWGLRTECIAFYVIKWLPFVKDMERIAHESGWLWVENTIRDIAANVSPTGQGIAARWTFPGLGKWIKTDTHLWHDTADQADYAAFARSLGLDYSDKDFSVDEVPA